MTPESSSRVINCNKDSTASMNLDERSELTDEITPQDPQELLGHADTLKDKVVYFAEHLVYKYSDITIMKEIIDDDDDGNDVSSESLDNMNKGGLSVPTMSAVFSSIMRTTCEKRLKCVVAVILLSCYPL